jgi:alkylated DNA repair dioxygenase AlkB
MPAGLLPGFNSDELEYVDHFIDSGEAGSVLERLWQDLAWRQEYIFIFGRRVLQPRLTAWYGDPGTTYSYSGLTLEPLPWHEDLLELKTRLENYLGRPFNSVLANAYRDGRDSMGWHSDDEAELGTRPAIASISLGAERRFVLRSKGDKQSRGLNLGHGSLLVMKGDCQRIYQHSLPKTSREAGLRINLTYRFIRA